MKNQSAEEIVRRFQRGFYVIRALRLVACGLCLWGVLYITWWRDGSLAGLAVCLLVYVAVLYGLRLVNSLRFLMLNRILNGDCDPVKFAQVNRLLLRRMRRTTGMWGLNVANGLYWSGDFAGAAAALGDVALKGKNPTGELVRRNVDFNCRMALGDGAGAETVRLDTAGFVARLKEGSPLRREGERLLDVMAVSTALERGDYETVRTVQERLSLHEGTLFLKVVSAYRLAQADLAQGEMQNALARLAFVAERGGTLWIAAKARQLLAERT